MKRKLHSALVAALSLTLAACNLGVPAPQGQVDIATTALTVESATPTAQQVSATFTAIPGVAIDGTTAEAPSTACTENYSILLWERNDVKYDKAEANKPLNPNEGFSLTWTIQNTGTCTWTDGYTMHYDSGERITADDSFPAIALGLSVPPGGEMKLSIPMAAPSTPGSYETSFRMDNAEGQRVLFLGIITTVGKGISQTNGLNAPGGLRYIYDCSGGVTRISITWEDQANNESGYRIYRNGSLITDLPAGATLYDDFPPAPGAYQYSVAAYNSEGESTSNLNVETSNCK